jgi:hypothetical protein
MNVGVNHGCVYAHLPAGDHALVATYCHHSHGFAWAPPASVPCPSPPCSWRQASCQPHSRKLSVHEIGPDFALLVADMLEDQQAQDRLSRSSSTTAAAAPGMPLRQRVVHTAVTTWSSARISSTCRIHPLRRSLTSSAIKTSPKLSWAVAS